MNPISPQSLNKLIDDTGRIEISKAFKKTLIANTLSVCLIGCTLFGLINAALSGVLILGLVIWGHRQVKVSHDAATQIQQAYVERGLHAPEAPAHRWKAEALVDALREYDAAKKIVRMGI
ncbi:hypothetical protein [Pseudomonas amygdali]|uniref:Uncharacterized protein n=2 Tax=Pseudomonas amygdali pv. lachrymans TaxID=53707 RepID=A0ABR5KRG5_PSEAV|nr:hypothetical protein [Pseudomonas amygdali]AXH59912.1 hypothetical protein PLA107_032315 [Pseudomonas amygdali pv. lachrymans str. M301315]KPC17321.1 Uncharacterized protein AC499_0523 [Pseudomonas amygdali pv. lachrymans]RMT06039.1 hypothetical protein ALP54_03783 [Pseudomonas amygdali pv. lachrymans]